MHIYEIFLLSSKIAISLCDRFLRHLTAEM